MFLMWEVYAFEYVGSINFREKNGSWRLLYTEMSMEAKARL